MAVDLRRSAAIELLLQERGSRRLMGSLILQTQGTGQYFFPTKLLSVLSVQSPVLAVAEDDSELARAVREGEFGVNVPPGPRAPWLKHCRILPPIRRDSN